MSDNGPQNQRNALRITFGGPSDSTGSNQNGGARSKQRRPQGLPNNTASWFTALTQHGKEDLKFPRGQGVPQFGVLGHEHGVQRVEHGPCHIPVEIVGGEVQGVGVGQQVRETTRDGSAVLVTDANMDGRGLGFGNFGSIGGFGHGHLLSWKNKQTGERRQAITTCSCGHPSVTIPL